MSDAVSHDILGARLMREGLAVLEEGGLDALREWVANLTSAEIDVVLRAAETASGIAPIVLSATDQALWDAEVGRAQ